MPLNGKVILLTGASGGLGSVVTPILSGAGATLIIVDRMLPQDVIDRRGGFTADVTNEARQYYLKQGMQEYLGKPVTLDALRAVLDSYLQYMHTQTPTLTQTHIKVI